MSEEPGRSHDRCDRGRTAAVDRPARTDRADLRRAEADPRLADETVTRPHPLLAMLAREELVVVFAPAAVWDRGRELLEPFAPRFAEATALLVLLGRPTDPALGAGAAPRPRERSSRPQPTDDELFVAVAPRASSCSTPRRRAETRGAWLHRYRYELGELIDIARAMTTERDVDKLLGVILEKSRFVTGADAGSIYVVGGRGRRQRDASASSSRRTTRSPSTRASSRCRCSTARSPGARRSRRSRSTSPTSTTCPPGSPFALRPQLRRADRVPRRKSMLVAPLISPARRGHRRHPAHQQEARPGQEAPHAGRRRRAGRPVRRAQRGAPRDARRAGRRLARERAPLRRDPQPLRGLREGERRGDRVARPDDERSLAPRRRPDRGAGEGRRRARRAGPYAARSFTPRGPARARVREPAPRLRQDRRAREGARQGEEALRRAARARSARASTSSRARSRPTCSTRKVRALERGASPRRARARSTRELAQRRAELDERVRGDPAPPTSPPCWRAATSRASRRSRARPTSTCAATCSTLLDDEEIACLEREARLAHAAGVRRDPLARRRTPSASSRRSRGARRSGASRSSRARTTSG